MIANQKFHFEVVSDHLQIQNLQRKLYSVDVDRSKTKY